MLAGRSDWSKDENVCHLTALPFITDLWPDFLAARLEFINNFHCPLSGKLSSVKEVALSRGLLMPGDSCFPANSLLLDYARWSVSRWVKQSTSRSVRRFAARYMAYWCSERLVVTVAGPTGESVVTLDRPFARVGSHPCADVVIADSVVARRALYLHGTPEGVYCMFLDVPHAAPEEKGRWLDPDHDIAVGEYRVRAGLLSANTGDAAHQSDLAAWGSAPLPLPVMMVYCGDLLKDKRGFRATLSAVGRRPQCGLQLKGKKVSSFHCVLYWDREKLWCIDLASSNGTTLNGQPLDCSPICIGDRLEVGEFGLVFQRISQSGGKRPAVGAHRHSEPVDDSAGAEHSVPPVVSAPHSNGAQSVEDTLRPAATAFVPSAPPANRDSEAADERRLRDELRVELVRLASEREAIESRWNAANAQWQQQIAELRSEAVQLAQERAVLAASHDQRLDERHALTQEFAERSANLAQMEAELARQCQALEQSRQEWLAERQLLTDALAARAEQLGRLEAELTSTTAELKLRLAEADARRQEEASRAGPIAANAAAAQSPEPLDPEWLDKLAPTSVVAGLEPAIAAHLAAELTPEVAWSYAEIDAADELPPPPDPQAQMQARWEEANEQLLAQVQQLRAEAAQLADERQALLAARDAWLAERDAANKQLTEQQERLAGQQAELTAAASLLTLKLSAAEQRLQSLPAATTSAETPQVEKPVPIVTAPRSNGLDDESSLIDWDSELTAPPAMENQLQSPPDLPPADTTDQTPVVSDAPSQEPMPVIGARRGGVQPHDAEQLARLVSTRVGKKYAAEQRRWLWWTAGGLAAAILVGSGIVGLVWVFS